MFAIAILALAAPAFAQGSGDNPPDIGPNRINRDAPEVLGGTEGVSGGVLPFTGAEITLFVLAGAGAIGLGTLMVRAARNKRTEIA